MDILYQTDEVLTLRPRLWRILVLMGLLFVITGIFIFFYFGQKISIECIRTQSSYPNCIVRHSILGYKIRERNINNIISARVAERTDSDDDVTYRIVFETKQGNVPLTSYYSSGRQNKVELVEDILAYLGNIEMKTLNLEQERINLLLMPIFMGGIGIIEILFGIAGSYHTWQFNKVEGIIEHRRIGFGGIRVTQYDFSDIIGVDVSSSRDSDGDTTYRIVLLARSGDIIPLTSWFSSGYTKKLQTAAYIGDFMAING